MIKGEYLLDGEWIPNQFTTEGMKRILRMAFQGASTYAPWYVGLCDANPADDFASWLPEDPIAVLQEPEFENGYMRQVLNQDNTDWPVVDDINNESYVESKEITFTATGVYSRPVSRFFIGIRAFAGTPTVYRTMSVSSAFPDGPRLIDSDLTTKYRLYFR